MKHILIIGNSAAGVSCASALRKKDKSSHITIVSSEDYPSYNRCLISYYLSGDIREDRLVYRDKNFFSQNNIELLLNKNVVRVDPKKNQAVLEDTSKIEYDTLLLACGASPKFPHDITGIRAKGVFGLRTISDVRGILELVPFTQTACVLGGGLIGLKAAYSLKKRKIEVKLIVKSSHVLSQILDEESARMCKSLLIENGIEIISGSDAREIIGEEQVTAVKLDSGKVIATSLVVVGKGVKPNIELAQTAGIQCKEGVLVDESMRTTIPNIYAAGDIAQAYDPILEKTAVNALWPNAVSQGLIVAGSISGGSNIRYPSGVGMNSLEFFGLSVISFGITKPADGFEEIVMREKPRHIYKKIVLKNNLIKGAVFVNKIENIGILLKLARLKVDVSGIKDILLSSDFNFSSTRDLPYEKEEIYPSSQEP